MYFVAMYKDRPGSGEARKLHRPAHVEYRLAIGPRLILAGALLTPDGSGTVGSMMVFEADDHAAAQAFAAGDPFVREGVLDLEAVTAQRIVSFNPPKTG